MENKLLNSLKKLLADVSKREEDRIGTYANHSESWQDSEEGEKYAEFTEIITDLKDSLKNYIEEIENFEDKL